MVFTEQRMDEVEVMLKKKREASIDLKTGNFATLQAVRGFQFGREIYSSLIKFKDLRDFLTVFPEVQRELTASKVGKIKTYILSGLEEDEMMRFFSAVTVTCRSNIFYDEVSGRMAIDTKTSKLSINDGQHRFLSIAETVDFLRRMEQNGRNAEDRMRYKMWAQRVEEMVIPLVIFNQISEREEKQLFADLNNLASRPSRSATIRLSQTDLFAQMANELAKTNKFMLDYGIEYEKSSIGKSNPNLLLLTTIYLSTKELLKEFGKNGNVSFNLAIEDYESTLIYINDTFNEVFRALPYDIQNKNVYIAHKHFSFKGIMRYIRQARQQGTPEPLIFAAIKNVDWSVNLEYWGEYGATMAKKSRVLVFPAGEASVESVRDACFKELALIKAQKE